MNDVVVFGEAIWDLFPRAPGEPISRRRIDVRHPGGAPANVARTLARLGLDVALVTALGDDALGDGMIEALREAGVHTKHVVRLPARTAVTFVDVATDGARRFLFYRHPSADMTLERSMLDARAFRTRVLHFGTSTLARSPSREATMRAIDLAASHHARLSLDLNVRPHLWPSAREIRRTLLPLVERVDVLKVSEEDVAALGIEPTVEAVRAMHLRRRREGVTFFTLGARGAVALCGDRVLRAAAPPAKVVDVTGAGDAFVAGALATIVRARFDRAARGLDDVTLCRALEIGCALGTRAVGRLGATAALRRLDRWARRLAPPATKKHPTRRRS